MRMTWQRPDPFQVGLHTREICSRIDAAIARYRRGASSFLIIAVPFRHGKSDLLSRYLPPKFLGEFPDAEVLLATYEASLSEELSRFARRIVQSPEYARIFPTIRLAQDSSAVSRWGIHWHTGGMVAVGLGGAMTGRGYSLGLVDDFLRNRQDAESKLVRDRIWDSFTNDFLTRRAPASITIILATPWHTDDLIGRAKKAMEADAAFPRFEVVRFPAFDDSYPTGTLFPERFSREWYDAQRAALGTYGTASLLQCDPQPRSGNVLKTDRVQIHDTVPDGLRWVRAWDLASTAKDVLKSDPDYTAGCLLAIEHRGEVPHVWIRDMVRGRWEAPERDRRIVQQAQMDGPGVRIGTESVAGYKDTFARLCELLSGIRIVESIVPAGDKLVRVSPLEPIYEAGNVHLVRGDWNQAFLQECAEFPSGAHDDQVDAMSGAWSMAARRRLPRIGYAGAA
jgi:predicted phage terminase large subunit-like protein